MPRPLLPPPERLPLCSDPVGDPGQTRAHTLSRMKPASGASQGASAAPPASAAERGPSARASLAPAGAGCPTAQHRAGGTVWGLGPTGPPPHLKCQCRVWAPVLLTNQPQVGGARHPSLGLITCQNGSQNSGQLSPLPVCFKGCKPGAADGGGAEGKAWGRGAEVPCPPPGNCPPRTAGCVFGPHPRALQTLHFTGVLKKKNPAA